MRSAKKLPVVMSGLILGLVFAAAGNAMAAQDQPQPASAQTLSAPNSRAATQAEFARRLQMIEELEVTKDDAALSRLVQADTNLDSYYIVLRRAATHLADPQLVEKLLDLPVLDKNSPAYKQAVGGVFSYIAANESTADQKVVALLVDRIKGDQATKNSSLRFIFSAASSGFPANEARVNVDMARLLVKSGADPDSAAAAVKEDILKENKPGLQQRLADLDKIRLAVSAPG